MRLRQVRATEGLRDSPADSSLPPSARHERRMGVCLVQAAWERRPEGSSYLLSTVMLRFLAGQCAYFRQIYPFDFWQFALNFARSFSREGSSYLCDCCNFFPKWSEYSWTRRRYLSIRIIGPPICWTSSRTFNTRKCGIDNR